VIQAKVQRNPAAPECRCRRHVDWKILAGDIDCRKVWGDDYGTDRQRRSHICPISLLTGEEAELVWLVVLSQIRPNKSKCCEKSVALDDANYRLSLRHWFPF
jgi:hypothetical protein